VYLGVPCQNDAGGRCRVVRSAVLAFTEPGGLESFQFGYSVGIAPGYPFIVIGEHFRDVGTTSMAGQVYVYKLN
jgi:hypothetical protein